MLNFPATNLGSKHQFGRTTFIFEIFNYCRVGNSSLLLQKSTFTKNGHTKKINMNIPLHKESKNPWECYKTRCAPVCNFMVL